MVIKPKAAALLVPSAHIRSTMEYAILMHIKAPNPQAAAYWFKLYKSC